MTTIAATAFTLIVLIGLGSALALWTYDFHGASMKSKDGAELPQSRGDK